MYTLIICEKPSAAKTIAEALSEDEPKKFGEKNSVWYEFERDDRKFVTVPAVGHLFTLKQKSKGWNYPVFDVEWIPSFKASRAAAFSEPYFKNIETLAKDASNFIVATDYDDEGEIIGMNILRFLCGRENASRMKFSTMTREELVDSYLHAAKSLNKNLAESGFTRHYLDWYWGINFTRALTNSIKAANKRFRILSTGRVQGPVLHMLAKHERKIKAFKPKPFWQLELDVTLGKQTLKAVYSVDKIWNENELASVTKKLKAIDALRASGCYHAIVKDVKTKIMKQSPPKPFNTTSMLADIYRFFGYTPQQGLNIAESLYQAGLISYPRTSSEKLPKDINYAKIIKSLAKQKEYEKDSAFLLQKGNELKPNEGARTDPAHPSVYPTGQISRKIGSTQQKVYDLIVRRFLSVFGDIAEREMQKVSLDVNGEIFYLNGKKTVKPGWTTLYGKYAKRDEVMLPALKKNDQLDVKKVNELAKETQPPPRYSQGSVLKEMEQLGLGTKATRAQILQILYNRGYLIGKSIEVTELGENLDSILERNVPDVISEKLTKNFESECDLVELGQKKREEVLAEAQAKLIKVCNAFKKNELRIGEELTKAVIAAQDKQNILGACPKCGGTLKVHKNWRTKKRFVGCSGYKKGCRVGFPLPREGVIISTEKTCESCKTPVIQVYRQGERPFRMCLDPECPTKKDWLDAKKLKQVQQDSRKSKKLAEQNKCPECGKYFKSQRALTLHANKAHKSADKVDEASNDSKPAAKATKTKISKAKKPKSISKAKADKGKPGQGEAS